MDAVTAKRFVRVFAWFVRILGIVAIGFSMLVMISDSPFVWLFLLPAAAGLVLLVAAEEGFAFSQGFRWFILVATVLIVALILAVGIGLAALSSAFGGGGEEVLLYTVLAGGLVLFLVWIPVHLLFKDAALTSLLRAPSTGVRSFFFGSSRWVTFSCLALGLGVLYWTRSNWVYESTYDSPNWSSMISRAVLLIILALVLFIPFINSFRRNSSQVTR